MKRQAATLPTTSLFPHTCAQASRKSTDRSSASAAPGKTGVAALLKTGNEGVASGQRTPTCSAHTQNAYSALCLFGFKAGRIAAKSDQSIISHSSFRTNRKPHLTQRWQGHGLRHPGICAICQCTLALKSTAARSAGASGQKPCLLTTPCLSVFINAWQFKHGAQRGLCSGFVHRV